MSHRLFIFSFVTEGERKQTCQLEFCWWIKKKSWEGKSLNWIVSETASNHLCKGGFLHNNNKNDVFPTVGPLKTNLGSGQLAINPLGLTVKQAGGIAGCPQLAVIWDGKPRRCSFTPSPQSVSTSPTLETRVKDSYLGYKVAQLSPSYPHLPLAPSSTPKPNKASQRLLFS